jgi:predicted dehydrogenase
MLKAAVIGLGDISKIHIPIIQANPDVELTAVCDIKLPGSKFYYGASHMKLINQFYTCISNNTCDYVHVKDALPSIQIIDSIRKSSELNKEIKLEVLV